MSGASEREINPWFSKSWTQLCALMDAGSLPHALLLEGMPGTGRRSFAMSLAQRLLCESARAGACGECRSCGLFEAGTHTDFLEVAPEEEGKAIGIAGVRAAIHFASGTASLGARKVTLVTPAESMTMASFNAFLKSLEEPSNDSFIILVVAKGAPLPATIRSRCQRWLLAAPTPEQAREWLLAAAIDDPIPKQQVDDLLRISANQPLSALGYWTDQQAKPQLALDAALDAASNAHGHAIAGLRIASEAVAPQVLLDQLERKTRSLLREQRSEQLRSSRSMAAFSLLDEIHRLRNAVIAGTNPNPDLLRFRLISDWVGLWTL